MKPIVGILSLFLFIGLVYGAEQVVSVRAVPPAQPLEPGKPAVLTIELKIEQPYHINADRPLEDYLIPTTLEFEPQPGLKFGKIAFPPATVKKLFSDSPMALYEGVVTITTEIIADSVPDSQMVIKGKLGYQACNDLYCLPPAAQSFAVALPLEGSGAASTAEPASRAAAVSSDGERDAGALNLGDKSLLGLFALVFLGGLALNLTPCVYPMIPITITYFGGQAEGRKGSLLAHSSLYVIGMAVTYSILGVFAAMTGELFGAAMQYPPVLAGIALILVVLALSMFDVYEFRMPQALNRIAGRSQKGFWGTFLMGLTVGIVAAPCIGPFVLALLTYVGNKGNPVLGFALFFVLALGLGVPFLLLGIFSGSLRRLPRSGAWMVWVRKAFGFVLIAMAVFFLKPLFPTQLAYYLALALVLLLAGIYMAWIDSVPGSGKTFAVIRNIIGIAFFASALYAAVIGLETDRVRVSNTTAGGSASIQWLDYSESVLKRASSEGKPVFIDFYADWCAPCKELDERTYSAPEVVDRSKDFLMVKVDLTSADDPEAGKLQKKFQVRGVPTLLFLSPDGREIMELRGTGFETSDVFLRKMDRALKSSGARHE